MIPELARPQNVSPITIPLPSCDKAFCVKDVRFEHPRKAHLPMLVTDSGIVSVVKEEQFSKALYPILVIFPKKEIEDNELQFEKVKSPIEVTPTGTINDVNLEQPEKEVILVRVSGRLIDSRALQPDNGPTPIVTLCEGIVILVIVFFWLI